VSKGERASARRRRGRGRSSARTHVKYANARPLGRRGGNEFSVGAQRQAHERVGVGGDGDTVGSNKVSDLKRSIVSGRERNDRTGAHTRQHAQPCSGKGMARTRCASDYHSIVCCSATNGCTQTHRDNTATAEAMQCSDVRQIITGTFSTSMLLLVVSE
jgi:hypothetical protein